MTSYTDHTFFIRMMYAGHKRKQADDQSALTHCSLFFIFYLIFKWFGKSADTSQIIDMYLKENEASQQCLSSFIMQIISSTRAATTCLDWIHKYQDYHQVATIPTTMMLYWIAKRPARVMSLTIKSLLSCHGHLFSKID